MRDLQRRLLIAALVAANAVLARDLFAQGTGCDATCVGFNPGCAWMCTHTGGQAQGCQNISTPYSCGGNSCGNPPDRCNDH